MAKRGKSRKRSADFSVESLREEVNLEFRRQDVSENIEKAVRGFDLGGAEGASQNVLLWALILRFGMKTVLSLSGILKDVVVLPATSRLQVLKILYPAMGDGDRETLFRCGSQLSDEIMAFPCQADRMYVLSPPTDRCLSCKFNLVAYNSPVKVDYFNRHGSFQAVKVSLKCNHCGLFYGYSKHGNPEVGWSFYPQERSAIEVSDVCFMERSLLKWQISFA